MNKLNGSNCWCYFFLSVCASLISCQAAFGDYKGGQSVGGAMSGVGGGGGLGGINGIGGSTANAGNSANGGTSTAGACDVEGDYQCTDTAVEVCDSHQWQSRAACSRDLCDDVRGRCMSCTPGSNRCAAFNLQTCASTGDSWTTTKPCDTVDYCDAVSNTCLTCLPGEAFCSGASLYQCNSTQKGWDVTDCGSPDLCDSLAGTCQPCPGSDYVYCNAKQLMGCDSQQRRIQLDECTSSELCNQTLIDRASDPAAWNGQCDLGCTPREYRCNPDNGVELQSCPPSALDWVTVDACITKELCDAANKQCTPGGCVPGTYKCDGAKLEICKADGTGYDVSKTCQDANHCSTTAHDCVACVQGQSQCSNGTLQTCGADLTWKSTPCASAALCDATNGKCKTPGCTQTGTYHCSGAILQKCPSDLTAWADQQTCFDALHCDAANGRCDTVECSTANAYRCQGNTRQQCDSTTHTWKDQQVCDTTKGQVCDLTAGCSVCVADSTRCNSVGNLTQVEKCTFNATTSVNEWKYVKTCASSALCIAGDATGDAGASCKAPICTKPGQYQCVGKVLQICRNDLTGWDTVKTCAADQTCDFAGGQCDICTHDTYSCNGSQLMHCSSDGQTNTPTDCGSASRCYASSDKATGYCYVCDASTDTQCSGTSIQTCGTDRRSWKTATACANGYGCQDNPGNADYCAVCPTAGEVRCAQTDPPGSTQTCDALRTGWSAATNCSQAYGCIVDSSANDYCAGACTPGVAECIGSASTSTTYHKCNLDGKGWGATSAPQCADTGSLKACVNGAISSTAKVACGSSTPNCVTSGVNGGQCVQCTSTSTRTCTNGNGQHCAADNTWVTDTCSGTTPVCSGGVCVQCTSTSTPTCTNGNGQHCGTDNKWVTDTCTSTTSMCLNGKCVACLPGSYTASCANSGTAVQSCSSSGSLVTTNCADLDPNNPVCYQSSSTSSAVCSPCNNDTIPDCMSDGVTRRTCVNGAFSMFDCTSTGTSTACLNGNCVGCDPSKTPRTCPTATTFSMCNSSGTVVTAPCTSLSSSTPYCSGAGNCVQCYPDSPWICTGSNTRQSCSGGVVTTETCSGTQICDQADDTCKAPTCAVNEYKCSGNVLQKCNASRTGWDPVTTCSGTTPVCREGTGTCGCTNSTDCAGTPSTPVCSSSNQCVAATCNEGQYQCVGSNGSDLQKCNSTRTGWDPVTTCSGTTPVCREGTGTCGCTNSTDCAGTPSTPVCSSSNQCVAATCNEGQYQCVGNNGSDLQKCNSTRTGWDPVTTCTSSQVCNATTGMCDAAACQTGDLSCIDNTPQTCNSTRTGWTANGATCTSTLLPICSSGVCVQCGVSTDCSLAAPVCAIGVCIGCAYDTDCPNNGTCQPDGSCLVSGSG